MPPWFWALLRKALKEVLNSLHILVAVAILNFSVPDVEWEILEGILPHKKDALIMENGKSSRLL